MILKGGDASYNDGDPRNAVIERFNAIKHAKKGLGEEVDWAELIAELIHAYMAEVPKLDLVVRLRDDP